ncbi:hypothetical protein MTR67_001547 [Solanum verrucosum]|uniref:Uncharacterized protein n=1 Tax=Solanum verrucosum TaxID=315347 RepID=A0AAF0PPF9_SOLVR|nr:hypothetical protein MTR67_001547 [Solanum verrucosum]
MEEILKAITTLCIKVDSMDNEIQKLKSKTSQQHDYKNAELRRSEDGKNPELKGDDGKLLKTHNICLNIAAGTNKQVSDKQHKNVNLNQLFEKSCTQRTPRHMSIEPQTSTYADSLQNQNEKKTYNYMTRTYIENIHKIQTYLNRNPRSSTKEPNQDYSTQKLQGYNKLIAQPKTNANLVRTCYNYGLLNTVYTYDGEEVSGIPELHKAFVTYKRVTKGNLFYIKFYTAPTEILYEEIKPPIQFIKIGLTKDMIIPEDIGQQEEYAK